MSARPQFFTDGPVSWALLAAGAVLALAGGDYPSQMIALGSIYALALLGVDLVVGYAGMITLGHAAVFGAGAYAAASLSWKLGVPMGLGLVAGVAAGSLVGWLLSLPALRAMDKYVALATLVVGKAFEVLFVEGGPITNGSTGITLGKRVLLGHTFSARDFALIGLLFLAMGMVAINRMSVRSIGRAFEAIRDSEIASDCLGVSPGRQKQMAFILSGVFTGLAGALFAYSQGYIAPNTFGFDTSVAFLLAIMLGGKKSRSGAILGAAVIIYLPLALNSITVFHWVSGLASVAAALYAWRGYTAERKTAGLWIAAGAITLFVISFFVENMSDWREMIYGLLIMAAVFSMPEGLAGILPKAQRKLAVRSDQHPLRHAAASSGQDALTLSRVGMNFDGFVALDGVDLNARNGQVIGIIGPNGAGKSTLMNVITGVYKPTSGSVAIQGQDTASWGSAQISKAGIARTFQNLQVFTGLTAIENVLVGLHKEHELSALKVALGLGRDKDMACTTHAQALLEFVGLGNKPNTRAGDLSYGEQRLLEIARALATSPSILLLDEPAAGLRGDDLAHLKKIIRDIAASGVGVLVIEHHMDLITGVCDEVLAINFGKPMASGTPAQVLAHPQVRAAYLG